MQVSLIVNTVADDVFLVDWSTRVRSCNVRTNEHGYESCEADLDLPFYEAFNYYQQYGPLKIKVSWGSYRIWEGRIEDPTQIAGDQSGLKITALGGWSAYNDIPYSALWSDTAYDHWAIVTQKIRPGIGFADQAYKQDRNDRLYITLEKNAVYANNSDFASFFYAIPNASSRDIVGISFDLEFLLPTNWKIELFSRNIDFSGFTSLATFTGTGTVQVRSYNLTFTGKPLVDFLIYNLTGANYTNILETGDWYAVITNIRVVTSITNRIDTTFTVARAAGTNVTATVGSNARMFVGQRLNISNGAGTTAENVTVLSLTSTNQFNATFVNSYGIGDTVRAHVVYPDEIIAHTGKVLNLINPNEISTDQILIQSQAIDLDQARYVDQYPTEIINDLIAKSDTSARRWVAMVYDDKRLIVRPRGSGVTWYTDIAEIEIARTLSALYNSTYAIYKGAREEYELRTANNTDALSVSTYGITRRNAITIDTLSGTQAAFIRDTQLAAQKDPIPRAKVKIDRLLDQYDNPYPLFFARTDDILVLRNLPPTLGAAYDKLRTLVIAGTDYDMVAGTITLDLELPIPDINVQIAQALKG